MDKRTKRIGLKEAIESFLKERKCNDCAKKQNCSIEMKECCQDAFIEGFKKGSLWMQKLVVRSAFNQKEWEKAAELFYIGSIDPKAGFDGFMSLIDKKQTESED